MSEAFQNKTIGRTAIPKNTEDNDISGIYPLRHLTYSIHKKNKEKILKASYNFKTEKGWIWTSLYLCFDKGGYPRQKAVEWLSKREESGISMKDVDSDLDTERVHEWITNKEYDCSRPARVRVEMNDFGYPVIAEEIW